MPIAIPLRKSLVVRKIAAEHPELSGYQIAKLAGTNSAHVLQVLTKRTIGRDKPKSRRPMNTDGS